MDRTGDQTDDSRTRVDASNRKRPGLATGQVDIRHPQYQEMKSRIHHDLLNRLNLERLTKIKREDAEPEIRSLIVGMLDRESDSVPLSLYERESLITDVLHELFGLGPLEVLLANPEISDILVNRYDQIYIERNGKLEETELVVQGRRAPAADHRADRQLGRPAHRRVEPDGGRAPGRRLARQRDHSAAGARRPGDVDPPLPHRSPRRAGSRRAGVADAADARLPARRRSACRLNVIISGGTGAGKTTLLNVLSGFISETERIVTIEDAAELMLRQRHVVRLETRPPNIEDKGAIRQRQLVINALRMRPDRIIVGEVRGEEALDMLQAMNTGHDGSLTTIHANSPRDALYRLDTMVAMANLNIPERAVRQQIASADQRHHSGDAHVGRHPQGDGDLRDHRHGAGRHHDAGHLRVRAHRACGRTARCAAGSARPASGRSAARLLIQAGISLPMDMFEHVKAVA